MAEGPVGPVRVVMLDVLGKDCFEVTAAEDEHPVKAQVVAYRIRL